MPTYVGGCNPFIASYRYVENPWGLPVEGGNLIYWEVHIYSTGEDATNPNSMTGLVDVVRSYQRFNNNSSPVGVGTNSFGYRGDGVLRISYADDSPVVLVSGLEPYEACDRVKFALNLETGDLWTGINEGWQDDNYPMDGPPVANIYGSNPPHFQPIRAPYIHMERLGDGSVMHTVREEFRHTIPAGFRPLSTGIRKTPRFYPWALPVYGVYEICEVTAMLSTGSLVQSYYPVNAPVGYNFLRAAPDDIRLYHFEAFVEVIE